jgi:hypothetical protein
MYLPRNPDLSFQNALKQFVQVTKPGLKECSFAQAMERHNLYFYMQKNALSITTWICSEKNLLSILACEGRVFVGKKRFNDRSKGFLFGQEPVKMWTPSG